MKRILSLVLVLSAVCMLLCGCFGYRRGRSFDEAFLKEMSLEGMPLPSSKKYYLNTMVEGQETLKVKIDRGGFEAYVEEFVEYMRGRTDIYYFGLQENDGLIAEMLPHRVVYKVDEDFECDSKRTRYAFSYSVSGELSEYGHSCDHEAYESFICVTMQYDGEEEVAKINISKDPTFGGCIDAGLLSH